MHLLSLEEQETQTFTEEKLRDLTKIHVILQSSGLLALTGRPVVLFLRSLTLGEVMCAYLRITTEPWRTWAMLQKSTLLPLVLQAISSDDVDIFVYAVL
ncbi:hypothetical protein MTO96_036369 [Rhipicephalus appendiculatus]